MKIVGSQTSCSRTRPWSCLKPEQPEPIIPWHHQLYVVIAPTDVRRTARVSSAPVVEKLSPGQQVMLIESANGWGADRPGWQETGLR